MRFPLPTLTRAGILAACVLCALPAPAEGKGFLMLELKISDDLQGKIQDMLDHEEQVSVHCDVYTTPGPLTGSYWPADYLGKKVSGTIQDLSSQNPKFTFGPFAMATERRLEYGTQPDSTVDLMAAVDIQSSSSDRLPLRFLAAWKKFTPEEYQAFTKTVETQGARLSGGSSLVEKVTYSPLITVQETVESKGAGAVEQKTSSR